MRQSEKGSDDDQDWMLNQPELSLAVWKAMEATRWRHLPSTLLGEPDWLIHDLYVIAWRKHILEEQLKSPAIPHDDKRVFFGGRKDAAD